MLLRTLKAAGKAIFARPAPPAPGAPAPAAAAAATDLPLEEEQRLGGLHERAGYERHLDILYRDVRVAGLDFAPLYRRCLAATGTPVTAFNAFQRFQTRFELARYFLATLEVPGARAECGVYRGATALMLAELWRAREPSFDGEGLHLIDSFTGTSASVSQDLIAVRGSDGTIAREAFFPVGKSDTSPELVRGFMTAFPRAGIHAGWIPQVFATLPDLAWAFVHLDVTLYEPTLAALEYFHPRLSPGGVIVCDGSIFCPGAERAWRLFCDQRGLAYVVLGHRETVLVKA